MLVSSTGYAASPSEDMVKSCLQTRAVTTRSIAVEELDTHEFMQEDQYADGFDAIYIIKYGASDIGYAENKTGEEALIYAGKIYRLSQAISSSPGNRGLLPGGFVPTLADWRIVKNKGQRFLCVSFNFPGLGSSGTFQNVRGEYLLNMKTRSLYFYIRDIRDLMR